MDLQTLGEKGWKSLVSTLYINYVEVQGSSRTAMAKSSLNFRPKYTVGESTELNS